MGLFDKKKKEHPAEKSEEKLTLENTEITDEDSTERFSVLVENVTTMLDGEGRVVIGTLNGKITKADKVFIYQPGVQPVSTKIIAIEAKLDNRTAIVDEAEDTTVSLQLELDSDVAIKKFAVLTNVGPEADAGVKTLVENAALSGLITGMASYGKDNNYHAVLSYWVSHTHFITPIKLDVEPKLNDKGIAQIDKNTKVAFYMLKSSVKLTGTPEGKDSMVLPLFTDWESLRRWEGLTKDGQKVHTQILSFQQLYGMLKRGDVYAGIAINPFNKVPCTLPIPYLDTITNTPGYKHEFGENQGEMIHEEKQKAGQKILLGLPKETEEITAIRQKLVEYGTGHEDILSIGFLTKVEEATKVVRHLIVLEFDDEYTPEQMKPHMEAIFKEINPLTQEIKQIEYAVKGKIKAIDDIVAQHKDKMVIYSK